MYRRAFLLKLRLRICMLTRTFREGGGCEEERDGGIGLAVDSWYREMLASILVCWGMVGWRRAFFSLRGVFCKLIKVRCQLVVLYVRI